MSGDPRSRLAGWLESAWLARYLDRELTPAETEWFETYVLDKPELLAMIETDNDLRDALDVAPPDSGAVDASRTSVSAEGVAHRGRRGFPWLASAASLLIGVGLGSIALRQFSSTQSPDEAIGDPTRLVFDTTRGVEQKPIVEHAGSGSAFLLIEVAVPQDAQHAELKLGDAPPIELTPSPDGFVTAIVARSLAKGRTAELRYTAGGKTHVRNLSIASDTKGDYR